MITKEQLAKCAAKARQHAYAPYSNYKVGAALLTDSEKIFTGCNVENASYGLANCAERTAVFNAISEGHKEFRMIAISLDNAGTPCGACRQVLNEFAPNMTIILADQTGAIQSETTLTKLLPNAFGPKNLGP